MQPCGVLALFPGQVDLPVLFQRLGWRLDVAGNSVALPQPARCAMRSRLPGYTVFTVRATPFPEAAASDFLWESLRLGGHFGFLTTRSEELDPPWCEQLVEGCLREERLDELDQLHHPVRAFSLAFLERFRQIHPWRTVRADQHGVVVATELAIVLRHREIHRQREVSE